MDFFRKAAPAAKPVVEPVKQGVEAFFQGMVAKQGRVGRSWTASELRIKSFEDLHKLWFVLVRERDQLVAAKIWAKKSNLQIGELRSRMQKVKKSMARLRLVLHERKVAFADAKAAQQSTGIAAALSEPKSHVALNR
eukprot:EC725784.1.p1 GENE.EC725784.1~~EC725784.1.p1  ORF type:complete len:137 (+),score=10.93 EC725784.1:85-495(+)